MNYRDDEMRDLRDALQARAAELVDYLIGAPRNKTLSNRRVVRWGGKGSFTLNIAGPYRGRWIDWEAGDKGDLFDLIIRHQAHDFAEAVRWARDWLGWGDGPAPEPRKSDRLRREREEKKAREEAEQAKADALKIKEARAIWTSSRSIADTLGERYLRDTRCINSDAVRHATALRWSDKEQAVVAAVTDALGEVVAVQMIAVNAAAQKDVDRWPRMGGAKTSRGAISKGVVRLDGRSDVVCIAEGPETGVTIWAATGFETVIVLGGLRRAGAIAEQFKGRRVIVCRDDDARGSNAIKAAKAAVTDLKAAGVDVVEATPFEIRRQDKADFNDLAMEQGLDAVRVRVGRFAEHGRLAQMFVPVDEARARIDARVGEFMDLAQSWDKESKPPVHAMGTSVGTGKTEAALRHSMGCLAKMRASCDKRAIVIAVPEHRLSQEIADRFNAMARKAGVDLVADVWRGREAKLPGAVDDARMCADIDTVRMAQTLAADVDDEICAVCPHRDGCSYLKQSGRHADLWIVAHPMLFHTPPKAVGRDGIAALIVDEGPWQAGLVGVEGHPIEVALDALQFDVMPVPKGDDGLRLADIRHRLGQLCEVEPDGPLRRQALKDAYLDASSGADAHRFEWMRKAERKQIPDWRERLDNASLGRMALLWRGVEALAGTGGPERSGWLTIARNKDGVRVIRISGRSEIREQWQVPTLLVDALLDVELVRPFWPTVESKGQFEVDAPHQKIRQAAGRSFALRQLAPPKPDALGRVDEAEAKSRARARRNARAIIMRRVRELGGKAGAIGNKSVIEAMDLPKHVEALWFNAVAGRDHLKDARLLVVMGRPAVPPMAVERMAGALTGAAPLAIEGWYPRADAARRVRLAGGQVELIQAETDAHPDPTCERIRSRICAGELVQAIGRGRGVNRDAETPVEVLVLSDVVLPMPVDELLGDEALKPTPIDLMLAEGGIAFEDGPSAARAYPQLWQSGDTAKRAMQRGAVRDKALEDISLGECPALVLQKAGERQRPQRAVYDPRMVADPRAAIEAALGPLARFEVVTPEPEVEADVVPIAVGAAGSWLLPEPSLPPIALAATGQVITFKAAGMPPPAWLMGDDKAANLQTSLEPEKADEDVELPSDFWPRLFATAADCGHSHGDVADRLGVSSCHLSNIKAGRRSVQAAFLAAGERYIATAVPVQARLL